MELRDAIRSRRMVRSFRSEPLAQELIDDLLDSARRAPSAGNTSAVEFLVLTGDDVALYWDSTLAESKRAGFRWKTLPDAPLVVLVATRPAAYPERYGEPDKERTGLGEGTEAWSVPFWWVDAGMVVQNLLLLAHDAGLGPCSSASSIMSRRCAKRSASTPRWSWWARSPSGCPGPTTVGGGARTGPGDYSTRSSIAVAGEATGRMISIRVPPPGRSATVTRPAMAATSSRTMARPSPVPDSRRTGTWPVW